MRRLASHLATLMGRFDKEGFSVWRVDFKYNEELTQVFMSSNQVSPLSLSPDAASPPYPHRSSS